MAHNPDNVDQSKYSQKYPNVSLIIIIKLLINNNMGKKCFLSRNG